MGSPLLEFSDGRAPYPIVVQGDVLIGRAATCAVRLDVDGVADKHAQLTLDPLGGVWVQDLDSFSGTMRNGEFIYGQQQLDHGDELRMGSAVIRFRGHDGAMPIRDSAADRTQVTEVPPEVRAAAAAVESVRTVQMDAGEINELMKLHPVASAATAEGPAPLPPPPAGKAAPDPLKDLAAPPAPDPKSRRNDAFAPTLIPTAPPPRTPPLNRTQMGYAAPPKVANVLIKTPTGGIPAVTAPPVPPPAPRPSAAMPVAAPVVVGPLSDSRANAQAKTMMAPAPVAAQLPPKVPSAPTPIPVPPVSASVALPPPAAPVPEPAAPAAVPIGDTAKTPAVPPATYVPPAKGAFGSFSRAFTFITQMITLARANPALLKPLVYDLIITTPISIAIAIVMGFVHSRGGAYALLGFGTAVLYFADYACNSITASLIYDYSTTGQARLADAMPRVKRALPGIMIFAAVSALLDVASTYARERDDVASRILVRVLRAIWTTATYVIMPALVIEGISFGDAFKRSKALMDHDPTGVGAGVVAMSITSYIAAIVIFPLAWFALRYGSLIHPAVGGTLFFLMVNLYWSVSGWLKIAYSTCFYIWARECDRTKSTEHALAPLPLRAALDAA